MAAIDMLDAALDSPYRTLAAALKQWAAAERAVIEANNQPFELNRKLPEVARAHKDASVALLAAVEACPALEDDQ